jgi:hypothetical protein
LFALGCIVYELCTLHLAFTGEFPQIFGKITNGKYAPIPGNLPYSDGLRRLVELLLQKDPKLRPQAARIPEMLLSELQMPNYVVKNYENGDKFEGQFKDGKFNGFGTYHFANGDKYVGEFKDDKRHGQGTFYFADGNKYIGELKDGNKHGQGTFYWSDGDKYVGEFKDGKRHGQGTLYWADGEKYIGEWKDD